MEIIIKKEPYHDDYLDEYYTVDAKFSFDESATARDVIDGVFKAMRLDGYMEQSILVSMKNFVEDYCFEYGIQIDEEKE